MNHTSDVEAPGYVREELILRLQALHYAVLPFRSVDQVLHDRMGITLGSQLAMAAPRDIGTVLGVDGLIVRRAR